MQLENIIQSYVLHLFKCANSLSKNTEYTLVKNTIISLHHKMVVTIRQ